MIVWRLCNQKYIHSPFSGKGGLYVNGRWNYKGLEIVYTADTPSLAQLEILVHAKDESNLSNMILCKASVDDNALLRFDKSTLKENWQDNMSLTRSLGQRWLKEKKSMGLIVPSVTSLQQNNILLNPNHADFEASINDIEIAPFDFDLRIVSHYKR